MISHIGRGAAFRHQSYFFSFELSSAANSSAKEKKKRIYHRQLFFAVVVALIVLSHRNALFSLAYPCQNLAGRSYPRHSSVSLSLYISLRTNQVLLFLIHSTAVWPADYSVLFFLFAFFSFYAGPFFDTTIFSF